jgi:hypothetical protein
MKIIIKILNILLIIFVIIGIASCIYWVNEYRHRNDIDPRDMVIDSLQSELAIKGELYELRGDSLFTANQQTIKYTELWHVANTNLKKAKVENLKLKEVENLPIDKMLEYILDYFNSDTTDAQLIQDGDSIFIVMQPRLIDSIGTTIAQYEDNLELLEAYEIQIITSNNLINNMIEEKGLLLRQVSLLEDINNDLENQNDMYKTSRAEKEKQIKRLKFQRTFIGVAGTVCIVLLLL